jgi:hypothetical protein
LVSQHRHPRLHGPFDSLLLLADLGVNSSLHLSHFGLRACDQLALGCLDIVILLLF